MDDRQGERGKSAKSRSGASGKDRSHSDIGNSLRSVYQRTVSEDVPAEMLDLLNKLD